jgi:hypothetical protein
LKTRGVSSFSTSLHFHTARFFIASSILTMLPSGLSYSAVSASTEPLDDVSSIWKGFKLKRASSNKTKRRPLEFTIRSYRKRSPTVDSGRSDQISHVGSNPTCQTRSKHIPIIIPPYEVVPGSPCTSDRLSSSRASTIVSSTPHSLSEFPTPSHKSVGDSSSLRSRHVQIVIPDRAIPIQEFSTSPINLSFESERLRTPALGVRGHHPTDMATPGGSRNNTMDSQISAPSASQLYPDRFRSGSGPYISSVNSSQTSLHRQDDYDDRPAASSARTPGSGASQSPAMIAGLATPTSSTAGLSGLVCNVHRTTGREPYVYSCNARTLNAC